jgi:hypothetical protein
MASGLQFLNFNPATAAYREGEQRSEQRRAADLAQRRGEFDLDEAQRQSSEAQAQDAAIREALRPQAPAPAPARATPPMTTLKGQGTDRIDSAPLPPPSAAAPAPTAPAAAPQPRVGGLVAQRLAGTPGGGKAALQLRQNEERQRDQAEQQIFHYLSNPNTAHLGLDMAKRIGINIPPELANNTAFWQGTAISKQLYPDNPPAAQKFVQAFVQGGGNGDVQAATTAGINAAGAPVKKRRYGTVTGDDGIVFYDLEDPTHQIGGPQNTQGQFMTNAAGETVFVRKGRTQAEAVTNPDGKTPLKAQKFGAHGASASVFQQKYQAYLAAHPNDTAGALAYAQGTKQVDPATELRIATDVARKEMGNAPDPTIGTQAQRDAYSQAVSRRAQEIIQSWRQPQQGAGSAAPMPQPQAPVPTAQPAPRPAPAAAPNPQPSYPMPQSQEEFDALPSGAVYIDPDDGILYRKP